ncbi:MAG: hypothetical protein GX776_08790 [Oxalobacter sp.]|nr:hypothetical protein [Oxalobacter sp.]
MPAPDNDLFDAVEHLRDALYVIRQQLQLYADLTVHEQAFFAPQGQKLSAPPCRIWQHRWKMPWNMRRHSSVSPRMDEPAAAF